MATEANEYELNNRQHSLQNKQEYAVYVKNACKSYGWKSDPFIVLDNLHMAVPKGSIYGLLGSSGCGKTTLLGCILGRKKLNSGDIWVLGQKVGSKGQRITGHQLGYMPQELALYGEFSIRETLKYFGWIADMTNKEIEERMEFLIKLLLLPDATRLVSSLSGGQQRRVSLASALLHKPELMILDEPTSGVDPLLRQIIWDYLVEITKEKQTTVIITTHYIDETRQAHLIGMMRGGYLLIEESPQKLLDRYRTDTLEEVFLQLSVKQNLGRRAPTSSNQKTPNDVSNGIVNESAVIEDVEVNNTEYSGHFGDNFSSYVNSERRVVHEIDPELTGDKQHRHNKSGGSIIKRNNMKALIKMNFLWMMRNWPVMAFLIALPVLQVTLFCAAIGHDPVNLPLAVVNYETNNTENCDDLITCNATQLSCNYLKYLKKRDVTLKYFQSEDDALNSVLKGDTYASVVVRYNYTKALKTRVNDWQFASSWNIKNSEIDVFRDLTSKDIANYLQVYFYQAFQKFFQDYLQSCEFNDRVFSVPIQFSKPLYGQFYPNFTDFVTPGMILTIIFFLSVASTAGAMLIQRNQGSFERALIVGITSIELLVGHIICNTIMMTIQMVLVLIFTFLIFGMSMHGSLLLVVILTTLTGFCGMCFGFAISCSVDSERMATYAGMGSFIPFVFLSGIIWPVEAMHYLLQLCSFFMPLTNAVESMRSILQRGWGLSDYIVYLGFGSVIIWIFIFLAFSILVIKFKKS